MVFLEEKEIKDFQIRQWVRQAWRICSSSGFIFLFYLCSTFTFLPFGRCFNPERLTFISSYIWAVRSLAVIQSLEYWANPLPKVKLLIMANVAKQLYRNNIHSMYTFYIETFIPHSGRYSLQLSSSLPSGQSRKPLQRKRPIMQWTPLAQPKNVGAHFDFTFAKRKKKMRGMIKPVRQYLPEASTSKIQKMNTKDMYLFIFFWSMSLI